jgi:hypothetical protein
MKTKYFKKLLRSLESLIKAELILKNQANHFRLFPYYWELLPVKVEKAMTRNSIETIIHQRNNFRLHRNDF